MRNKRVYLCQNPNCERSAPERGYLRWQGQCDICGSEIGVEPVALAPARRTAARRERDGNWHGDDRTVVQLSTVGAGGVARLPVGIRGVDAVLGGGLPEGGALILSGSPGIGKSTITLQLAAAVAAQGQTVTIFTGEENKSAIKERWNRLELGGAEQIYVSAETDITGIESAAEQHKPRLLVVDSLKTVYHPDLPNSRGSHVQQKECTERLMRLAKRSGTTVLVTQHVNKEDEMAGARELAHMYDAVLRFENAGNQARRLLAEKNRFGATNEIALFTMTEHGLEPIPDVSAWALAERVEGVFGSVVVPVLDGSRVHLVELQALSQPTRQVTPTRRFVGVDKETAETLLAILSIHGGIDTGSRNMYFKVVRDLSVAEPAGQLAVLIAAASAVTRIPVPKEVALIGEVDMGGAIRSVDAVQQRVQEAARYGFTEIYVPAFGTANLTAPGITLHRCRHIQEVLSRLGLRAAGARRGAAE